MKKLTCLFRNVRRSTIGVVLSLSFLLLATFGTVGCVHTSTVESQSRIDRELKRVKMENEALDMLAAQGCPLEKFELLTPYINGGEGYYMEYGCRLRSGTYVKLVRINGKWHIHRR